MKKWSFIRGNRIEYFAYLLLLSTLLILVFSSVIYYYTSDKLVKDVIQSNTNTLQLLRNAQETVMNEVDRSLESIFFDSVYSSFNDYYEQQDILMVVKIQEKLSNVAVMNSYIHSLYLVYPNYSRVLADQTGIQPIAEFRDRAFVSDRVLNAPYEKGAVITRKVKGIWDVKEQDVITLVKTIPLISQSPNAYLVVNVRADYLLDTLNVINTNENARIMVMDRSGSLIAAKSGVETQDYSGLAEKLAEGERMDRGYQIVGSHSQGTLISYVSSKHHDWLFLYTIPMSVVLASSRLWGQVLLVLCVLTTLLGAVSSFLLSGRFLSPIRRMLSLVRSESNVPPAPLYVKEVSQLEMNIHTILDKTKSMEEQLKAYEEDVGKRLLQRLLEGKQEANDDKLVELFKYYGQEVDLQGWYTVMLVSMDQYAKYCSTHSEKDRNTLFLELAHDMRELMGDGVANFVVELDSGELAGVLHRNRGTELEAEQAAGEIAQCLHSRIGGLEEGSYTFTIGVSKAKYGLGELSRAYYEAQSAIHDHIIYGTNRVIYYHSEQTESEVVLYPYSLEKKLLVTLKSGDKAGALQALTDFGAYIQGMVPTVRGIMKYYFLQLYTSSLKSVVEVNPQLVAVLDLSRRIELMELDTLPELLEFMQSFCERVFSYYGSIQQITKNQQILDNIKSYIQQHPEDDLSQERLGDMFKISASHLRKIFKEETGQTFKDYVLGVRLEQAKELLRDSDLKVVEVANKVGYFSTQSFVRTFRQVVDMTPTEYRETSREGSKR